MDYVPHDKETIHEMLREIGINSLDDLYVDIPEQIRMKKKIGIGNGMSEADVKKVLKDLARENHVYDTFFLGAGNYYHYRPALIDTIVNRSEFLTAYTPYQAEASQGFLQAIFEYQTAISRFTGMDVSNASMYDGATSLAEAVIMCEHITRRKKIIVLEGLHPHYLSVLKTYCWARKISIIESKYEDLSETLDSHKNSIAGVIFQNPSFFGEVRDLTSFIELLHVKDKKILSVLCITDPTCLGVLKTPGEYNVDIFVAEGQPLGIPPSFGGPGLGIFCVKKKLMRKMPGRLIGKTKELYGEGEGFVLTLQAREQHIRREKALSNICSNQAHMMLQALIYLVSLGKTGLKEVALQNMFKANMLRKRLSEIKGVEIVTQGPIYNEFIFRVPVSSCSLLIAKCKENNFLPPLLLERYYPERKGEFLVCVTEMNTKEEIESFVSIVKDVIVNGE